MNTHGVDLQEALIALGLFYLVDELGQAYQLNGRALLSDLVGESLFLGGRLVSRVEDTLRGVDGRADRVLLVYRVRDQV